MGDVSRETCDDLQTNNGRNKNPPPNGRRIFISRLQKMTVKMIVFDNKINSYCKVAGGFLNIPVLE